MKSLTLATTEQLSSMAGRAKAAMGVEALDAFAYRGYFKGAEVLACELIGVTPYVSKPLTSVANAGSASSTSSTYRKTTRIGVLPEKR
jgi:transposase